MKHLLTSFENLTAIKQVYVIIIIVIMVAQIACILGLSLAIYNSAKLVNKLKRGNKEFSSTYSHKSGGFPSNIVTGMENPKNPFLGVQTIKNNSVHLPLDPVGIQNKIVGHELTEAQEAFIKQCKIEGKTGCTLTINNQQTYVSFYENKEN